MRVKAEKIAFEIELNDEHIERTVSPRRHHILEGNSSVVNPAF